MILSDFTCPIHGRFEALVESDSDYALCPVTSRERARSLIYDEHNGEYVVGYSAPGPVQLVDVRCAQVSPWTPSPVAGRVELVSAVSRGKWEPPPMPTATNTRGLMEGQNYGEWRKERKKVWRDHDYRVRKERG